MLGPTPLIPHTEYMILSQPAHVQKFIVILAVKLSLHTVGPSSSECMYNFLKLARNISLP